MLVGQGDLLVSDNFWPNEFDPTSIIYPIELGKSHLLLIVCCALLCNARWLLYPTEIKFRHPHEMLNSPLNQKAAARSQLKYGQKM